MKPWLWLCLAFLLGVPSGVAAGAGRVAVPAGLREGDIVFSGSDEGQGAAIMAATGSPYTHCGVVFAHNGKLMVIEAVHPVRVTDIAGFLARSKPGAIAVKRLKTPPDAAAVAKAREWAAAQIGRPYDGRFQWSDERLYCSELVWKVFSKAGVELCKPRAVREYHLDHPKVRALIAARFGSVENLRLEEKVVAPSDLASSSLLQDVPANGG